MGRAYSNCRSAVPSSPRQRSGGAAYDAKSAITFTKEQKAVRELGLDEQRLAKQLEHYIERIAQNEAYKSIELPVCDETLRKMCQAICDERGLSWGKASDMSDVFLIHKHKLRDRSDVIAAREEKKKSKELPNQ